jgi:hypothetical protein
MELGQYHLGGYYAGIINDNSLYHIIVSPKLGNGIYQYGEISTNPIYSSTTNGWSSSNLMLLGDYPAAKFCRGLNIGQYSDWYLPAIEELSLLYQLHRRKSMPKSEVFDDRSYLSSTSHTDTHVMGIGFHDGDHRMFNKEYAHVGCRAIRRIVA